MAPGGEIVVRLLGGVDIRVDGRSRCAAGWPSRRAGELVQLLAVSERHRLHREQVLEALWPHLPAAAAAANLRKAAHHARQALQDREAVVLRGGQVALFPGRLLRTDVAEFEAAADSALRSGDPQACAEAGALYPGELLPELRYEEWTLARRDELRARYLALLRAAGQWERLVDLEPAEESAYCALMRDAVAAGRHAAALRWYARLSAALERELGVRPGPEAQQLYDRCVDALRPAVPTLIGRELELAAARAALRAAADGSLTALAVRGPAGMGKSALCRQVAASAREQGWRTVTVQLAVGGGPYAPLVLAVEQLVRQQPQLQLPGELPEPARSVLAALTSSVVATPADLPVGRHQVVGAVRRLLLAAGGGRPVLLVVDDVHLADDDAAAALLQLAGTSASGGLLVVLAHRPVPERTALLTGLLRLERAGCATTIDLTPLPPDQAAALVVAAAPAPPPTEVVARVVDRAAGNPFFLLELTRAAVAGEPPEVASSLWQAVTRRFVDVDAASRAVLEALAVAGDELTPAVVVALTGLPEEEAFALLDRALAAGVLVVADAGYAFRHALVREALLAQVPPHRRTGIHRDAARRLGAAGAAPEMVARHWLAAEEPEQAAPFLEAAARRAIEVGAFVDALARLDTLLKHAPGSASALFLRAQALEALGDRRAPTAYAAAAQAAPECERDEVRARQALASVRASDPAGAVVALEGVEARTLQGRLAQALALAGAAAMGFADVDLGVARAAETRRLAVASGDPSAVVIATWAEAAAAHAKGTLPATLWSGLVETYALPELAVTTFDGQLCVTERLLYGNRPYATVIEFADALEAEAVRRGAARGQAFAATLRGEAWLLSGHLDRATVDLTTGARRHREIGACAGESLSLQRLAEVALYSGERARAHELLDEALAVARDSALGFHLFDRIYGSRIAAAADPAQALAAVQEAEESVHGFLETCPGCRITLAVPAAIAAARAGDLERAQAYEAAAEQLTVLLMRLPGWYAALDEVRGERAVAQGDLVAGRRHLRAAAKRFREAGQPLDGDRCAAAAAAARA